MAPTGKRVGVLSDNSHLVVGLSLQGEGLEVERVGNVAGLAGHDVGLVDLGDGQDPDELAILLPDGPAIVFLADGEVAAPWATIVHRPYTYGELLDVLRAVQPGNHEVFAQVLPERDLTDVSEATDADVEGVDEPGPGTTSRNGRAKDSGSVPEAETFRLFTARRSRRRAVRRTAAVDAVALRTSSADEAVTSTVPPDSTSAPDIPVAPAQLGQPLFDTSREDEESMALDAPPTEAWASDPEPPHEEPAGSGSDGAVAAVAATGTPAKPDPVLPVEPLQEADPLAVVGDLASQVTDAFSRAPFLVSERVFADRLSALIRDNNEAAHVALWRLTDGGYNVVGAAGLRVTGGLTSLPVDHPLLVAARENGGSVVERIGDTASHAGGLPGSVAPYYACLMVERDGLPIDLVTISGDRVSRANVHAVQIVVDESIVGWESVAHVEELRQILGLG